MFEQILELVKEHVGNNPEVAALPQDQQDALHNEVAQQVSNNLAQHASSESGGIGGMLSQLQTGGGTIMNAIEGGLVGSLSSKLGLSPGVSGAISAAIPSLLQKFATKANDPNDSSISLDGIKDSLSKFGLGNLGSMFGK
ncbi:MAG: hypothetical protein JST52_11285 [Bacteroidetes bacterium]|nr:hypothetical protein [Bacteroidota bacterium]MBS1739068.1 hypothetical protein [Bacteroidota bacterium]MBS1775879.1 hypothetical protein [Bacteroidota bacterium]